MALMKTEGALHDKLRRWIDELHHLFRDVLRDHDHGHAPVRAAHGGPRAREPWLFSIVLVNMLAIANIPREFHLDHDWRAFLSSCVAMITLMVLFGLKMYPNMVSACPIPKTA